MNYNFFSGMFQRGTNALTTQGAQSNLYELPETTMLTLNQCENIYTYWGLGKRVIHALPRFAFSAPREINIQDAPPEAVEEFIKTSEALKQDRILRRTSIFCRIYGMAGLFVAYSPSVINKKSVTESAIDKVSQNNLTVKEVQSGKISFNALNPLNLSGTIFSQDAVATNYQKPEVIMVKGIKVGSRRATVIQNSEPVYLRFSTPTFAFSGVSVYQNMITLIKAWSRAIVSLERMATKASSIVFKDGSRAKMAGITADAATISLARIRDMENTGACSIDRDAGVEFFPLTGVAEVDTIIKGLNGAIMMALDDTPASILLDKDLSNGLSEGTEQMKAIIMAVENFREEVLTPLYALTDPYVMAVAWTDEFIQKMIKKYPDKYVGYTIPEIRQLWQESFDYEFGNLYPPTGKEQQETNKLILDNLKLTFDMGGNVADIEAEINEKKIFGNQITLDPRDVLGEGEEEGKEDNAGSEEPATDKE